MDKQRIHKPSNLEVICMLRGKCRVVDGHLRPHCLPCEIQHQAVACTHDVRHCAQAPDARADAIARKSTILRAFPVSHPSSGSFEVQVSAPNEDRHCVFARWHVDRKGRTSRATCHGIL